MPPARLATPGLPFTTLPEILGEAEAWQAEAEAAIASCLAAGGKGVALARRTGEVAGMYRQLREALRDVPAGPERAEADQLLNYHEQLIEQALLLAFRPDSPQRDRLAAKFGGGLGDPARRLRLLAERARRDAGCD